VKCFRVEVRRTKVYVGGERLRLARVSRDVTQAQLAKAAGVTTAFICRIESEQKNPSPEVARKIEKYLAKRRKLDTAPARLESEGK
jgi:transcriptional regulator with XRE-family HTH domain